jgi:hypothetical protein
MEIDKCPIDIPGMPQSALMLEAHLFEATSGCDFAPLNHSIDSMQVIPGKCQGGNDV